MSYIGTTPYYLDAPAEHASHSILKRLGVRVESAAASYQTVSGVEIAREHNGAKGNTVSYAVMEGEAVVDFRDSADCWIRASVRAGEVISFPSNVYRRVTPATAATKIGVVSETAAVSAQDIRIRYSEIADSISLVTYHTYRELVCELCRQFFDAGWVTGTGGSISIRHGNRIYMTPSGVQKERIQPDELFVLDTDGETLCVPQRKTGCREPKLSDCAPLFLHAFQQRNAGAVLHSHAICCNIVTSLFEGQSEFRISHQEMSKGINGYGYYDELTIPIIENTAWEHELSDSLGETIAKYPKTYAVLVRRHGMYVWGDTWEQAKRHGECYHYLFEVAINMRRLGLDFNCPPIKAPSAPLTTIPGSTSASTSTSTSAASVAAAVGVKRGRGLFEGASATSSLSPQYKHYVFDIEGTTTPISFVKDVLFPYSVAAVSAYLDETWDSADTQTDVAELFKWASELGSGAIGGEKAAQILFLTGFVQTQVQADSKVGVLKRLQGRIWKKGYEAGELKSLVFSDVPAFFHAATAAGSSVSIYSSGSRQAQHLLFRYSDQGDLRPAIGAYFDTTIGNKRQASSYSEIALTLGADLPSDILFVTDIVEEAEAAAAAGLHSVISDRPGNIPQKKHNFKVVTSFSQLE